jgi:hypothetical protein
MYKVQKTAFADCSASSSEPFRLNLKNQVLINYECLAKGYQSPPSIVEIEDEFCFISAVYTRLRGVGLRLRN